MKLHALRLTCLLIAGCTASPAGDPPSSPATATPQLHALCRTRDATAPATHALISAGADVTTPDDNGWTPLFLAARTCENPAVLRALIDAGADVHALDASSLTPLDYAVAYSNLPAIHVLVESGADVNRPWPGDGSTLLMWACGQPGSELVLTLLDVGADPLQADHRGLTAIDVARMNPALAQSHAMKQLTRGRGHR